jgi:hypothetical protein
MTDEGAFIALVGIVGLIVLAFVWGGWLVGLLALFGLLFVVGAKS